MKNQRKRIATHLRILLLGVLLTGLCSGCDDATYDYTPPEGMGALIVNNFTGDRVRVYLDGVEVESVSSGGQQVVDHLPGVVRVALDSEELTRSWAGDVDILEGRRTVIELRDVAFQPEAFDVRLYFD